MKRKLFTAFVILGALSLTACQEDTTMDELLQDSELSATTTDGNGNGTGGTAGDDEVDKPGS